MAKKIDSSWIDPEMTTDTELTNEANARAAEDLTFVKLDGSRSMTGALNMDSHKITNVTNPTSAQDACTKSYADGIIPSQSGNAGKYLKTDGSALSWDTPAGGSGDTFNVVTTDFGTSPTASGNDTLNLLSADNVRYYFTGDSTTDTVTLTVTGLTPPGGDYGQVLSKASGTNFDVEWRNGVLITKVYNNTGSTITKGSVVYISGASGNLPTVALSKADIESTSSKTYGFVVDDISNNSSGSVVHAGEIRNLDTFGVTEGVTLWLSPTTAGGYTTTKPSAPDHMVALGVCTRAHATLGTIEVSVQNGFELQELHNVAISSVADKQYLRYESSTSLWKNTTPSNLTEATSSVLTITGGTGSVHGSGTSIEVKQSSGSQSGYLSSTDWTTFNGKPNLTSSSAQSVGTANAAGTATDAAKADHVHRGVSSIAKTGSSALYGDITLTAGSNVTLTQSGNDITIASTGGGGGGGSGTVTDVSIVSANGFAGTVATSTTTPAITLTTTITGVLKGNGTAISAATAGTDYQAPITGAASTITTTDLTASRALASDSSGKVAVSATTSTELGYVSGVTSAIQTQINNKPSLTSTAAASVASTNAVGTATDAARSDHTHRGVASLAKTGSTALYGAVTLTGGNNVTLTQSSNDISIAATTMNWLLFSWDQRPAAGGTYQIVIPQSMTITSASTKYAKCTTAATGSSAVFTIYLNGTSKGTVTFSTGATSGTFSITADISMVAGDLLKITAPSPQNADLAEVGISLPWQ